MSSFDIVVARFTAKEKKKTEHSLRYKIDLEAKLISTELIIDVDRLIMPFNLC